MKQLQRYFFITLIQFVYSTSLISQKMVTPGYYRQKMKADSLLNARKYIDAGMCYNNAFLEMGNKSICDDRYSAAISWARGGMMDSSFSHLFLLLKSCNFSDYDKIIQDSSFWNLRADIRWDSVTKQVNLNARRINEKLNHRLIKCIDSMVIPDQRWRLLLRQVSNGDVDSSRYSAKSIYDSIKMTDSLNYIVLEKIYEEYGFPNVEIVGNRSSENFWLLVQHQDKNPLFQEKVLNSMKIHVDMGFASKINYAYLIDRVMVNTNRLQIYGTQLILNSDSSSFVPKPVMNEKELDERRLLMGLGLMEDYLRAFNNLHKGSLKKK